MPEPLCLGLTGGIGSGKSAALDAFARRGAAVLSSDAVVHRLYEDPVIVDAVRARFGDAVIDPAGRVDRAVLGPLAFAEDDGLAFLESILHPRIGPVREEWIREQRGRSPRPSLLVCEVPLLFEVGLAEHFDAVLVVTASDPVRRMRVEGRGQHFDDRRAHQMDEDAKVAAADEAYVNDGSLDDLQAWVDDVMSRYAAAVDDVAP